MRYLTLLFIFIMLQGCAGPQIVEHHFEQDKILHMSQLHEVNDNANIDEYVFYLNKGDTIPLNLQLTSEIIGIVEDHVNIELKRKLYFRIERTENTSQAELDKFLATTPEQMTEFQADHFAEILKKIKFFIIADGTSWALLIDKKAVKKILGLKGGSLSAGMAFSSEKGLWFLVSVKMHKENDL